MASAEDVIVRNIPVEAMKYTAAHTMFAKLSMEYEELAWCRAI